MLHNHSTRPNLPRDTYPTLVSKLKVLIYNGDWDACVPYTDNQAWTDNMGYPTLRPWHAWTYLTGNSSQVGGYSIKYDVSALGGGSFEFRTVRGAGHMVPSDAPQQGLELFSYFTGVDYKPSFTSSSDNDGGGETGCPPTEDWTKRARGRHWAVTAFMVVAFVAVVGCMTYLILEIRRLQRRLLARTGSPEGEQGTSIELSDRATGGAVRSPMTPYLSVKVQDDT